VAEARTIRWTVRAASELASLDASDAYFDALVAATERAAMIPTVGRRVQERPDVYRVRSGRHWIYYRDQRHELIVLRITHTRRQRERL
jgi:plasmid stabilization system protein ParE